MRKFTLGIRGKRLFGRGGIAFIAVAWLASGLAAARASNLTPEQAPTFSVRARVLKVAGESAEGKDFSLRYDVPGDPIAWKGTAWSDWMPYGRAQAEATIKGYPAQYIPLWPMVVRLVFGGMVDPTQVEVELKLDETNETISFDGNLMGSNLGFLVWRDEANKPHAQGMTAYNRRYWQAMGIDPQANTPRPRHFPIVDRYIGGDDDRNGWQEGITELNRGGFHGIMLPPDKRIREMLLATGERRTAWAVYAPPGYAFDHANITDEQIAEFAHQQAEPYRQAGYEPTDMSLFALSDEPGWYYPAAFKDLVENPTALARFRQYLADQGLQPADVGHATWETVLPLGRSGANDLPSRRLFYWTMRFFPWDSARHFAKCTKALEAEFYEGMPIFTNWNNFTGRVYTPGPLFHNPDKQSPDAGMGSHDWFEFGRMRGGTMLWTEDWFGDGQAPQWSFYMARLRSAARLGNVAFGGYVIPRTAGDRKEGIEQKIMSIIGHGGKGLKYFVFGPEYVFPGNCYSEKTNVMAGMARAHAMIAKAEEVLWPGRSQPAEVAILAPRSSFIWDDNGGIGKSPIEDATNNHLTRRTIDYAAEVFGIYSALQHANIPCDFVDEDGLTANGLAPLKVLYVTQPNLPVEGAEAIANWVRAGGTLVKTSGAMQRDRYNQPLPAATTADFSTEEPRSPLLIPDLSAFNSVTTGTGSAGDFSAVAVRGNFSQVAPGSEVVGTFADDKPAIVKQPLGNGHVLHFAWMPGLSYLKSSDKTEDGLPVGFSESLRDWIVLAVRDAGVQSNVVVNHAMIETPLLLSDAGAAITLLNWTGKPLEELELTARLPFQPTRVESVQTGPLPFTLDAGVVRLKLPLNAVDVISLRP